MAVAVDMVVKDFCLNTMVMVGKAAQVVQEV